MPAAEIMKHSGAQKTEQAMNVPDLPGDERVFPS
jgi:hypothetical protein